MSEKKDFVAWSTDNNREFFPSKKTIDKIPSGVYGIKFLNETGFFISKQSFSCEDFVELPCSPYIDINKDVDSFWKNEHLYNKMKFVYKKGILIHGAPGNGKTTIINQVIKSALDNDAIVLKFDEPDDYKTFIPLIRSVEPNRFILVVIDKMDFMFDKYGPFALMDLLDSLHSTNKVLYIASATYVDKLLEIIYNKPNRIDKKYEITHPKKESRKAYFDSRIKDFKIKNKSINTTKWAEDTDGFSISFLKELITSVVINGEDYKSSLDSLKDKKKEFSQFESVSSEQSGIGFK